MTSEYPWKQRTDEWGLIVPIENCLIGGWPYTNPHIATENPIHIVPCMGLMELGPPGSQRLGWGRYFMYTISTKWTISITQTKIQLYRHLPGAIMLCIENPLPVSSVYQKRASGGMLFPVIYCGNCCKEQWRQLILFWQSSDSLTVTFLGGKSTSMVCHAEIVVPQWEITWTERGWFKRGRYWHFESLPKS